MLFWEVGLVVGDGRSVAGFAGCWVVSMDCSEFSSGAGMSFSDGSWFWSVAGVALVDGRVGNEFRGGLCSGHVAGKVEKDGG